MQVERAQEILRLLERTAVEHLSWLMRVHCRLLFPEDAPEGAQGGGAAEHLSGCGGDLAPLAPLARACAAMRAAADRVLSAPRAGGVRPDPAAYRAFMDSVDEYGREAGRAEAHFRRALAETDPLTGVRNRHGMMRELRREWTRAVRTGRPCCVAIADLDFFKHINDTWGHVVGDKVLCLVARFFARRLRPYDLVFRYGGEEFLFCLPDTDLEAAIGVLDRLRQLMARSPVSLDGGGKVPVTCSIGVAELSKASPLQQSVCAADHALYAAKERGRNRVEAAKR